MSRLLGCSLVGLASLLLPPTDLNDRVQIVPTLKQTGRVSLSISILCAVPAIDRGALFGCGVFIVITTAMLLGRRHDYRRCCCVAPSEHL